MIIVTNQEYTLQVKADLAAVGASAAHVLAEPEPRNTAPAIALAVRYCQEVLGASTAEVLLISPADHVIYPVAEFAASLRRGIDAAKDNNLVTFGITPTGPETGYGYIQTGQPCAGGYSVISFKEKPDQLTAAAYLASGGYYWNSGMFAFTIDCFLAELAAYQPVIYEFSQRLLTDLINDFGLLPSISIDYAIAEKSQRVITIPLASYWNDIGSWDAIFDVLPKDQQGNAIKGDCMTIDCHDSLLMGQSRLIAGIGLKDVLVVETDDVIVVAQKGESQKVKDLVTQLKAKGRREADEHTTMHRPWGSYTVMGEGAGYKMKKLVVNPGSRLSLQLHYHRSEHWIVISGTAKVTIGEHEQMVHENESVYIPQSTQHRLENPGRIALEVIEVQNGKYLGEDDIVRFEDIYGRI